MIVHPTLPYVGITIIMSNPSRADLVAGRLLTGIAGWKFCEILSKQGIYLAQCEVRTKEEQGAFRSNTKVVLLLGLDAFRLWTGNTQHTLGEIRGSIYTVRGLAAIASYLPQDCNDPVDYESTHNMLLVSRAVEPVEKLIGANEKRKHGITSRSNWFFFLKWDVKKLVTILRNNGVVPAPTIKATYSLFPSAKHIIEELNSTTDGQLYIDIETDENLGLKCLGYGFDNGNVTVFPIVDFQYKQVYPEMAQILRAFALACCRNTVVAHNGSGFDFPVLMYFYHILMGRRFYDTMLAFHRCFPVVEKSLGHLTSLFTYQSFHKDEGSGAYHTLQDMRNLLAYCGKDVYTMILIRQAIDKYALTIPGLSNSIEQVNDSIHAYTLMMMMGIHYKKEILDEVMKENDGLMTGYNRIINYLIGEKAMTELNRKSKKSVPGSNTKCTTYFHDMLGYGVVGKSKKTGKPSLSKKNLFKLQLQHNNPVISFCLAYRETAKESGSLKFQPWIE